MLPAECGLLSCQCPLIDMPPNAVGRIKARLYSRGHMHAAPRSQFPPLVSHHSPSRFPFAFTPLHRSYLCHSQYLATSRSLSWICDVLHAISYLFTSPSPASPCQPVSNCVFPLHLVVSLVAFLLCFLLIPCIFPGTFTFICYYIFSSLFSFLSYPALLSCLFNLSLYLCCSGSKSISS